MAKKARRRKSTVPSRRGHGAGIPKKLRSNLLAKDPVKWARTVSLGATMPVSLEWLKRHVYASEKAAGRELNFSLNNPSALLLLSYVRHQFTRYEKLLSEAHSAKKKNTVYPILRERADSEGVKILTRLGFKP